MFTYESIRHTLRSVEKPCAFLHVDALKSNIHTILHMSGNQRIRIASKSIRSVGILKMIMEQDERFQGVMCFTASEAIYLYEQGLDDLLVAYPTWDERQLREVCQLVKKGAIITLMVDSKQHVNRLAALAKEEGGSFLVAVDTDLSSEYPTIHFGVHRSPLRTVEKVMELITYIQTIPSLTLDGLMGYEAQIAGVVDNAPGANLKNNIVRFLKRYSLKEIAHKRSAIMKALNREGISLRFVNGGGTGSLTSTHRDPHVTEVTAGSGFYNSHLFDRYKHFHLSPAIFFAIEITRQPRSNIFTCAGGGYVASGPANRDKLPEIYLPQGATITKNEAVGEVQTPVRYEGPYELKEGDSIIFRPSKAGEICERFQHMYILEGEEIMRKKNTYRGDGKCFL